MVSLEEQIKAVEREIGVRRRIRSELIAGGARGDIGAQSLSEFEAVLETLKSVQADRKRVGLFDTSAEAIDR